VGTYRYRARASLGRVLGDRTGDKRTRDKNYWASCVRVCDPCVVGESSLPTICPPLRSLCFCFLLLLLFLFFSLSRISGRSAAPYPLNHDLYPSIYPSSYRISSICICVCARVRVVCAVEHSSHFLFHLLVFGLVIYFFSLSIYIPLYRL
jgi:hypothetical protein